MITLKKIGFAVLLTAFTAVAAQAQTAHQKQTKKHQCTEQCAHGTQKHKEEGKACKKGDDKCCSKKEDSTAQKKRKTHKCTAACENTGHCVRGHGEEGHTCNDTCKSHKKAKK